MGELTSERPKALLPVCGQPMLARLLRKWNRPHEGSRVTVICANLASVIEQFLDGSCPVLRCPGLGTGGDFIYALRELRPRDPVLLINGDTVVDFDLRGLQQLRNGCYRSGAILLTEYGGPGVQHSDRYARLLIEHKVSRYDATIVPSEKSLYATGMYLLDPVSLSCMGEARSCSLEQDIVPTLIVDKSIAAISIGDRFTYDIGDLTRYSDLSKYNAIISRIYM